MSHQLARTTSATSAKDESSRSASASSYREALRHLCQAYTRGWGLAVLFSDGKCGARYLIDHFLARVGEEVTVVRLTEPSIDEESAMQAIIRAIGFDPTDLSLADMENVLTLFLSFQARHDRRTILCIEEAEHCGWWLLDTLHRIAELKTEDSRGLMVLASGQPETNKVLSQSMLDAISITPERCIFLSSFTLAETREYLRWRVESAGTAEIAQLFEFDAITLIHEFTRGMTDRVSDLVAICLQLATDENVVPVTVALVNQAKSLLDSQPAIPSPVDELETLITKKFRPRGGRLVVRMGEGSLKEYCLDRGHVLIGRGKLCDVRIASPSVSRHHALIISSPYGAMLIDLESTNGTFVDGRQVKEYALLDSGVIGMGDCRIDYVGDDDDLGWTLDVHGAERAERYDPEFATQQLRTWHHEYVGDEISAPDDRAIKGNINSKGDKIYHVPGTSKYDATKIDESKGERWFRTEEEAQAAGWRPPLIK